MTTTISSKAFMVNSMTEAEWQRRITDLCDWHGLKWHHEVDSRKSKSGFPDLVIAGPSGVIFAELKREKGRVSKAQQDWYDRLHRSGAEVYIWRPSHWDEVQVVLRRLARVA